MRLTPYIYKNVTFYIRCDDGHAYIYIDPQGDNCISITDNAIYSCHIAMDDYLK